MTSDRASSATEGLTIAANDKTFSLNTTMGSIINTYDGGSKEYWAKRVRDPVSGRLSEEVTWIRSSERPSIEGPPSRVQTFGESQAADYPKEDLCVISHKGKFFDKASKKAK